MLNILELKTELIDFDSKKNLLEQDLNNSLEQLREIIKSYEFYDKFIVLEQDCNYTNNEIYVPQSLSKMNIDKYSWKLEHENWKQISLNQFLSKKNAEESISTSSEHLIGHSEMYFILLSSEDDKSLMLSFHYEYEYDWGPKFSGEEIIFSIPLNEIISQKVLFSKLDEIVEINNHYLKKFLTDSENFHKEQEIKRLEKIKQEKLKQFEQLKNELGK